MQSQRFLQKRQVDDQYEARKSYERGLDYNQEFYKRQETKHLQDVKEEKRLYRYDTSLQKKTTLKLIEEQ